jgi:hypothetical protein
MSEKRQKNKIKEKKGQPSILEMLIRPGLPQPPTILEPTEAVKITKVNGRVPWPVRKLKI